LYGMLWGASLAKRVECRTVSNALLKSNAMTMTYGFVRSKLVIVLIMEMSTAVVEPVGQKANWSLSGSVGGGERKAGYRKR
jgi:hypothetical protein